MAGILRKPVPNYRFKTIANVNPASVAPNTTADQTFTITGLTKDMSIIYCVFDPSVLNAGLTVSNFHVSAKDTLKVRFTNNTAGALDCGALDVEILAI